MDGENDGNGNDRNLPPEEDGAIRRNQVLIFGVVLLGILAICLAVSMPSDLEFNDAELPTSGTPINPEASDRSSLSNDDPSSKRNQTNSTSRKKSLRNQEVSVEVKLLRDMAIQKKIQEYDSNSGQGEDDVQEEDTSVSKEQLELKKVDNIVETFIGSEDFEDFLLDIEIHDAVKKLREQKGYKKKSTTLFDELFKRAEKEFIGEDEEELRLIRKVGEKLEKRAWDLINERKRTRGKDLTEPDELIANELLKLDYASSGDLDDDANLNDESAEEELVEVKKTEL
ncbi:unnamed protein product [Orchesella dallaii]|uniref:Transmembrane protein n=1 Tax=Orchesella dallaii TaxID=48710 RepID=A0ABP1Q264_9HEXA